MKALGAITLKEILLFLAVNLIVLIIGVVAWYLIWIKKYGGEIPNAQISTEKTISYLSTKSFRIVISELLKRVFPLDKNYLLHTVGYEGYVYLFFQRKVISLLMTIAIFSVIFTTINVIITHNQEANKNIFTIIKDFFINKNVNDYTTIIHIISIGLFTFLHFRFFEQIRREASYLFFDRFDRMSRSKNADWLCCRTLHISGISPRERNTEGLTRKLNIFLDANEGGRVIDINFVPDYREMLKNEKAKTQISNIRNLIDRNKLSLCRKLLLPKTYRTDASIQKELDKIDEKMQKIIERPVFSSGHAFVCLDSLISAYKIISVFQESTWKKIKIKFKGIVESFRKGQESARNAVLSKDSATFGRFHDEQFENEIKNHSDTTVNVVVDQLVDPFDIIWLNVGGDRGLYIVRRILCNVSIVLILIFVTYSTSFLSSESTLSYFSSKTFTWIVMIPYGHIIITYIPPLLLMGITTGIYILIGFLSKFESHYTHSNYQYSIFSKSIGYMLLNLLLIPGFALSFESLYALIKGTINLSEFVDNAYTSTTTYFFITLLIQSGTWTCVYYTLRLNELLQNSFSPMITFYNRHFINTGNQRHRIESSCFYYGFFYAQMFVYYTICLVFSTTIPLIPFAGLYMFVMRHITDFISLIMVHGVEMDSNGKLINHILNSVHIPLITYHFLMALLFLVKEKVFPCFVILGIMVMSFIYAKKCHTDFIFDFYKLHESLNNYDITSGDITEKEINEWRNIFRHPMVLPIIVDRDTSADNTNNKSNSQSILIKEG